MVDSKALIIGISIAGLVGCSTANRLAMDVPKDVVISRIDDMDSRPSWLKESEPFHLTNGEAIFLGTATIPGDDRVDAAYRIAENNAKAGIASAIESKLEMIFQNAEEGTKIGADQTRFIGSEVTSITTSHIRPKYRYWEKYASVSENGQRSIRYRIFAAVSMPEEELKRAVTEAIRKQQGKGGLSKEFAAKVDHQWDKLVEKAKE